MTQRRQQYCPTPVSIARLLLPGPERIWGRLIVSIIIDIIGVISHVGLDWIWAPIQTILIMALYEATIPSAKYVSFVEEILPFTDIIPTATIAWFIQHGRNVIQGKRRRKEKNDNDVDNNNDTQTQQDQKNNKNRNQK
jgi:hypothetical protein